MNNQRILYIQPIGGIAGDMFLGAALDAGLVSKGELKNVLGKVVDVSGVSIERDQRASIQGVRLSTALEERGNAHGHVHLHKVFEAISASGLEPNVTERAKAIFRILAQAEADVHGKRIDEVVFHEVGRLDSVADVCGAAYVLEKSNFDVIVCSPLPIGQGVVSCTHGELPLPGPAVLNILRGVPMQQTEICGEMVTPTGAAILKHCVSKWGPMPLMEVQSVGYGHGSSDWGRIPNSTRILVGTLGYSAEDVDGESAFDKCSAFDNDRVIAIEFNVDDMNPEYLPMIIDGVLAEGALDAYSQTIMGKKGRIGFLINVLLEEDNFDRIGRWLLANTTTAGFRYSCCLRKKLFRESKLIEVDGISVAVKRLFDQEKQILRCTIEADSLSEFCSKTGLSMTEAHNRIMAAARDAGW